MKAAANVTFGADVTMTLTEKEARLLLFLSEYDLATVIVEHLTSLTPQAEWDELVNRLRCSLSPAVRQINDVKKAIEEIKAGKSRVVAEAEKI